MTPAEFRAKLKAREWVHTQDAAAIYGCTPCNFAKQARRVGVVPIVTLGDYDAQCVDAKPGHYWPAARVLMVRKLAKERKAEQNRVNGVALRTRKRQAEAKKATRLAKLKAYYRLPKSERTLGGWTKLNPPAQCLAPR